MRNMSNMENRKDDILEATCNVMIDKGIEGLSISKVGEYAGIPKSLVFHYFTNKETLILELVDYVLKKQTLDFQQLLYPSVSIDDQGFEDYLDKLFIIDFKEKKLIQAFYACFYLAMRDENIKEKMRYYFNYERQALLVSFGVFAEAGVIGKKNIGTAIEYIMTTTAGIAKYADIENGQESINEELLEIHKDNIRRLLK